MSFFFFQHPTTILISGPTRSGKTYFVISTLEFHLINPFPTKILWFYKEWQTAYDNVLKKIPNIEFINGIDEQKLEQINSLDRNLVVMDDLMNSASTSKQVANLFTQESHHKNLTVILLVQNLFHQGKEMRTISLNAHYIILYKNPRDQSQIKYLSQQIFPDNSKFLTNVFHHATAVPHSYLIIDLHPETSEDLRILSNIFPDEKIRVYVPITI